MLTIITTISYDHMDILGKTLKEIAIEKAGIIKKNVPCIIGPQTQEVYDILIDKPDYPLSTVIIRLGTGGVLNPTNKRRVTILCKENLRLNLYANVAKCLAR